MFSSIMTNHQLFAFQLTFDLGGLIPIVSPKSEAVVFSGYFEARTVDPDATKGSTFQTHLCGCYTP